MELVNSWHGTHWAGWKPWDRSYSPKRTQAGSGRNSLQRHLGLGQGTSAERSLAPGENAVSRVTTPARPQGYHTSHRQGYYTSQTSEFSGAFVI